MNDFAALVSFFLQKRSLNVIAMSKYCDLDRSTMYKIVKGTRTPASFETIKKMAEYLQLTLSEKEQFFETFRITSLGKDVYNRRKAIHDFLSVSMLSGFQGAPVKMIETEDDGNQDKVVCLSGRRALEQAISDELLREAVSGKGEVCILTNESEVLPIRYLISLLKEYPDLQIGHITGLSTIGDGSGGSTNLKKLREIIIACASGKKYRPHYYYDPTAGDDGEGLPYVTNYVITSKTLIGYRNDYSGGICITDPDYIAVKKEEFNNLQENCSPVFRSANTVTGTFSEMMDVIHGFLEKNYEVVYQMAPCLFNVIPAEMLEKYMIHDIPDRESVLQFIVEYQKFNSRLISKGNIIFFHSLDGYRDFLETGRFCDIPEMLYPPLEMADRIQILKRYIRSMDRLNLKILKVPNGSVKDGLIVILFDKSVDLEFKTPEGDIARLSMTEPGYMEGFRDYFESLAKDDDLFYTPEEVRRHLMNLVKEYE